MIPGSANALLLASAAEGGYQISRSLRFNSSDSAYCSRVFSNASASTWTLSAWVKRSALGTAQKVFGDATDGSTGDSGLWFGSDDTLYLSDGQVAPYKTAAVYRDCSAWYHIVASVSSGTTLKIYVNGVDQTASGTPNITRVNSNRTHAIGYNKPSATNYFSGYLADVHFIDGQALTPSSFGEFDVNNVWQPKAYTGSYGTNGFQLKFADNSAATAAALGKDTSGNGHNWTPTNLSVTAGAGNDSLVDTPTSYGTDTGAGGEVRGNYATYNRLNSAGTLANGNLESTPGADLNNGYAGVSSIAIPLSGKWYAEFTLSAIISGSGFVGIIPASANGMLSNRFSIAGSYGYISINGNKRIADVDSAYGASYTVNDVIGVSVDMDNLQLTFYKNNASQGAISISSNSYIFCSSGGANSSGVTWIANFGQRPFAYAAPSGFKALCDTNLPTPVVAKPSTVMDVVLYTGNSTDNRAITGLGFSPDLVWFGPRSQSGQDKVICDSVRGVQKALFSNQTYVEANPALYGSVGSFDSAGFTIKKGTDATFGFHQVNLNTSTYVAWTWDAGSSTVTNTQGSITSQVRTNGYLSIVTYTGNSTAGATVGHGLGVTPAMIIVKKRSGASNWPVSHTAYANTSLLNLDNTNGLATNEGTRLQRTNSTVFTVGDAADYSVTNETGSTYVAYCFAPVAGYSNGFSYTGNGSTDGSFVYLGFRPRLILLKCSSTTGNWTLLDTAREGYNVDNDPLYPNLSNAEGTTDLLDITSNGFKLRTTDASVNSSGATYVGYAWAEAPFAYSRAR